MRTKRFARPSIVLFQFLICVCGCRATMGPNQMDSVIRSLPKNDFTTLVSSHIHDVRLNKPEGSSESDLPLSAARLDRGLLVFIKGVGDPADMAFRFFTQGLQPDRRQEAVIGFHWTKRPPDFLGDLMDTKYAHEKAAELALLIESYQTAYPGRPLYMVGLSGGCGVALFALERLGAGHLVDKVILLAAAVSPEYDLTAALRKVKTRLFNIYSPNDLLVLGLGTAAFGTMDRKRTESAGLVGFKTPRNLSPSEKGVYQKLVQIKWTPDMIRHHYLGGHASVVNPRFVREYIVPSLIDSEYVSVRDKK